MSNGPLRVIKRRVEEGAGSDELLLMCGHTVVKDHRSKWGRRTSCHLCKERLSQ